MTMTEGEIDNFAKFAKEQLVRGGEGRTIDDVFDEWRSQHPLAGDVLAVKASIRDMESGKRGRSFEQFAEDFCKRNNIPEL